MIDELTCLLFGYKLLKINFQFSSSLSENQVKMCVAIILADPAVAESLYCLYIKLSFKVVLRRRCGNIGGKNILNGYRHRSYTALI